MKAKMKKISEKFFLSTAEIDRFSEMAAGLLQQTNVNLKDILRFRLSMENVMDIWLRELGEGISCSFSSGSKFGRAFIVLTTDGKKVNPNEYQDELRAGISNGSSLLAAFGTNIECCERKLGIDRKLVNFGVPMGQVVYMSIGAVMFLIASLCIGESYGVEISMAWVLTAIFVSGILAAATPPIPGGAMSCYTILFTQLGIPAAGIALAISVDLIMDYFITACNITCLQTELVVDARKLDMPMESRLREKI